MCRYLPPIVTQRRSRWWAAGQCWHRMLGKFAQDSPVWIHQSHGLDLLIVDYLSAHWRLDYRKQE